jgi:hypothetical protein
MRQDCQPIEDKLEMCLSVKSCLGTCIGRAEGLIMNKI